MSTCLEPFIGVGAKGRGGPFTCPGWTRAGTHPLTLNNVVFSGRNNDPAQLPLNQYVPGARLVLYGSVFGVEAMVLIQGNNQPGITLDMLLRSSILTERLMIRSDKKTRGPATGDRNE